MQCACSILLSVACLALNYFSRLSHKRQDFRKMLLNTKCVFRFSLPLWSEAFFIVKRIERDVMKKGVIFNVKYPSDINETRISRQLFEKYSNIKFNENSSGGSRIIPCGRTERHDKANSRFSRWRDQDRLGIHRDTSNDVTLMTMITMMA